jgi:hypothetical protein
MCALSTPDLCVSTCNVYVVLVYLFCLCIFLLNYCLHGVSFSAQPPSIHIHLVFAKFFGPKYG